MENLVEDDSLSWPPGPDDRRVVAGWELRLENARQAWAVGSDEGPSETQFGRIWAVASIRNHVMVSDILLKLVRVFDADGKAVLEFAGRGDGPLEMHDVVGAAAVDPMQVALADPARIRIFAGVESSRPTATRTIHLNRALTGLCATGGRLFARVSSPHLPETVSSVTIDGAGQFDFGAGFPGEQAAQAQRLNRGPIACLTEPTLVVVAFDLKPVVRAYHPDGTMAWESRIHRFREAQWEPVSVGGDPSLQQVQDRAMDVMASVVALEPGGILLQVLQLAPDAHGLVSSGVDSYVLSAATGAGKYVGRSIPLVSAASHDFFWTVNTVPAGFQQLVAYVMPALETGPGPPD